MERVIITGATGSIGTALIDELVANNVEVLVICRKGSSRASNIITNPLVSIKYCNLEDFTELKNDTGKQYDVLYNFAWAGTTGEARNDMYLQNKNIQFSLDAVKMAKEFGCTTFVGAGSQAEYGRFEGKLTPSTPTFPENGYGMAKLTAGLMTKYYAHLLGMKHIWVRILSIYGPNDGKQSMVMSTIQKIKDGIVPEFTKGEQMWDYLYSKDAAKAFYLLPDRGIDGKTYVLGSGKAEQLSNYIITIRDAINPNAKIDLGSIPYSKNQVMHLEADISELSNDTGFMPQYSFERGIHEVIDMWR